MNQHFTATAGTKMVFTLEGNALSMAFVNATDGIVAILHSSSECSQYSWMNPSGYVTSATDDKFVTEEIDVGAYWTGRNKVCFRHGGVWSTVGSLTVTSRVSTDWTYVIDPEEGGSIEIIGEASDLDWKKDRIMITDCKATCGVSSPAKGVTIDGEPLTLDGSKEFVAKNDMLDIEMDARTLVDLPTSELTKYTTVKSRYCKGNNIAADELGDAAVDLCSVKCATNPGLSGCAEMDADNSALCLPEAQCKTLCSSLELCYGVDIFLDGDRCLLNYEGPVLAGCKAQYESGSLGSSNAYQFHVKSHTVARSLQVGAGLSTADILRFSPVGFASGGSYKVCFCDSSLLPDGQIYCDSEKDFDVEVGKVIVSGVSCLLAEKDFRRRQCYNQYHGGLACSDEHDYPSTRIRALETVLPSSVAFP